MNLQIHHNVYPSLGGLVQPGIIKAYGYIRMHSGCTTDAYGCIWMHTNAWRVANAYGCIWCRPGSSSARPGLGYALLGQTGWPDRSYGINSIRFSSQTGEWAVHAILHKKRHGPSWELWCPSVTAGGRGGGVTHPARVQLWLYDYI